MSFDIKAMSTIHRGGRLATGVDGVKSRHAYWSNDLMNSIIASGYFNDAADYLKKGDLIEVAADIDGTPATNILVVTSASGATPVTTQGLATVTQTFVGEKFMELSIPVTDGTYQLLAFPKAGTLAEIKTLLDGAITTNDAVLTFKKNGVAITNGVVTIANSGSAAGDLDTATPTAGNDFAAGDKLTVTVSGTPGGTKNAKTSLLINA